MQPNQNLEEYFESCVHFVCPVSGIKIPLTDTATLEAHKTKLQDYLLMQYAKQKRIDAAANYRLEILKATSIPQLNSLFANIFEKEFNISLNFDLKVEKIKVHPRVAHLDVNYCYLSFQNEIIQKLGSVEYDFLRSVVILDSFKTGYGFQKSNTFLKFEAVQGTFFEIIAKWQHTRLTVKELRELQKDRLSNNEEYRQLKQEYMNSSAELQATRSAHAITEQAFQACRRKICQELEKEQLTFNL